MRFETWFKADLQSIPQMQAIHGSIFTQDHLGNLIGVTVTNGGKAIALSGNVIGYVQRADGITVTVDGEKSGSRAWIILPEAAYAVPGRIMIAIRLVDGSEKNVLCACTATVLRSSTDQMIAPGNPLPSLEDLLAQIERMEQGTANAEAAAENAAAAAQGANDAAQSAYDAAENANAACVDAQAAAGAANQAAANANAAADTAYSTADDVLTGIDELVRKALEKYGAGGTCDCSHVIIATRIREAWRPAWGLGGGGEETAAIETSPYTGDAEISVIVNDTEYDADNMTQDADNAGNGDLIITKMEE